MPRSARRSCASGLRKPARRPRAETSAHLDEVVAVAALNHDEDGARVLHDRDRFGHRSDRRVVHLRDDVALLQAALPGLALGIDARDAQAATRARALDELD